MDILVVEDEKLIRDGIISIITSKINFVTNIFSADSGLAGIDIANHKRPHLIITDIRMPDMTGLEMARLIQEMSIDTSFVVVSGYSDFQYTQQAVQNNSIKDYLLKPIYWADLVKAVTKVHQETHTKDPVALDNNEIDSSGISETRNIIKRAKQFIRANYNKEISLQMVGDYLYLNPSYFSMLFKNQSGENFLDYLTRIRIENAKRLLVETNLKIYKISEMVGYKSEKHFITVFKKNMGYSPNQHRQYGK
ncbi:response regulator transcription factor [Cohnella abietis]|uniref:DNA-binding response regulator n=1 Tax=Cohnella abietis TaxID=2507935 RepID=A0A3T1DDY5_9BACL|nr:response regulator [Cohnella abietis]BBI36350.1 DNA-binding response regulator [Cohnella abietis]